MKRSFLEADPSGNLTTIKSLEDCQSLLNDEKTFMETPAAGEISADNFYVSPDAWKDGLTETDHDLYFWAKEPWAGETGVVDYNKPYAQVNVANEVIAALNRITVTSQQKKRQIEGTALFLRAFAFHNLLQLFARPYESSTAQRDTGIALPLAPDYNAVYYRASMEESYQQVIDDLQKAVSLLPEKVDTANRNKPTKPAAEGLLARVYLTMGNYSNAEEWAGACLHHQPALLDYNSLSNSTKPSFFKNNEEILYNSWLNAKNHFFRYNKVGKDCFIDPGLYDLYEENDLRKNLFYYCDGNASPILYMGYTGAVTAFSGLATDEMYLIRSECRARLGNLQGAADDLNALLAKRYATNTFVSFTGSTITLGRILDERRKELAFRGLRWSDLRRLNKEGAAITLQREINGNVLVLPPGDLRYTLPIPDDAIAGSRIVQNPR